PLVYQVVCYLSTTFFLIFQVFLKLDLLFYFSRFSDFVARLATCNNIPSFGAQVNQKLHFF
ncbi:hypothetical protein, partial [Enterococcus sp. S22(2020)]|uniref:hypothetical protein n=1 Tax=Enterococcus sp. S22(2020) TaxID=2759151 RepID=UPI001CE1DAC8